MDTGRRRKNPKAFTLIEMLIVMGILGLLFALLMPGIGAVRRSANRNQARQQMASIENAIIGFYTDYGRYPLQREDPLNRNPDEDSGNTYGPLDKLRPNDGNGTEVTRYIRLINSLRGAEKDDVTPRDNPRNTIYLNAAERDFAINQHPDIPEADDEQYIDPWMNRFGIVADWNMDGHVTTGIGNYGVNGVISNRTVAVWSWAGEGESDHDKHLKSWDP